MPTEKINIKELEITDPKLIQKYLNHFKDFYIPASEHDTYDTELLDSDILFKSSEVIGQKNPIEVAINEKDVNPESSPFHIHLRIIDGRHRWKQSIKHEVVWATKFYRVSDYEQYMKLRGHFDSKKRITNEERTEYFEKLAKYYEDVLQIEPTKICQSIIRDFSPPFNEATVRRYVPPKYKDPSKQLGCYASVKKRHPVSIKDIQTKKPELIRNDYARFRRELEITEIENEYLRGEIGHRSIIGTFYVLEEKTDRHWNFVHCRTNKEKAMEELNWLNPAKYRLRQVSHNYELIYKETTDNEILESRKLAEYHKKRYESKKFQVIDKIQGVVIGN